MIRNIRCMDFVRMLGSLANAEKLEGLLRVIESDNFVTVPDDSSCHTEGRILAPGRRWRGADFLFYNPHNEHVISYK